MKTVLLSLILVTLIGFMSCGTKEVVMTKKTPHNKTPDNRNVDKQTYIISVPVVEKKRIWKGELTDETNLYIQRSIADYFIKFCESNVSREEVEKALAVQKSMIKTLRIEIEYLDGEWDNCQDNKEEKVASRTGEYVIIHKIMP